MMMRMMLMVMMLLMMMMMPLMMMMMMMMMMVMMIMMIMMIMIAAHPFCMLGWLHCDNGHSKRLITLGIMPMACISLNSSNENVRYHCSPASHAEMAPRKLIAVMLTSCMFLNTCSHCLP